MTTNRNNRPYRDDERKYIATDITHNWRDHRGRYHRDAAAIFTRPTRDTITIYLQGTGGMWQFTRDEAHKLVQELDRAVGPYTPPVKKPGPFGW